MKIALVGRPNVGKSALFNRICQKRISIVDDEEGITRDRLYYETELFGRTFTLIDTGGVDFSEKIPFATEVKAQAELAIEEADGLIFVVDGEVGPTQYDEQVARLLRNTEKPVVVAINKMDRGENPAITASFASLGLAQMISVSALQGGEIVEMLEAILAQMEKQDPPKEEFSDAIRVAIVGRANVGKSTLLNHLLGEDRSIVSEIAGTTRDAIDTFYEEDGTKYRLIDTAGIRRKKSEKEVVDKFAAIRTERAIERCEVCLLILDAFEGFTTQEMRIAKELERLGKSCVLLFNKWDLVSHIRMEYAFKDVKEKAPFLAHCPTLFLSAKTGRNIPKVFPEVKKVYKARFERLGTGVLNKFMERCQQKYHPPLITGKRLRIYYLTQIETDPPRFVLFVNDPKLLTKAYHRYLINQLRETFAFDGCPLRFELRKKKAQKTPL